MDNEEKLQEGHIIWSNRNKDEHGNAICPKCSEVTNKYYADYIKLQCWKCGGYFPKIEMDEFIEKVESFAYERGYKDALSLITKDTNK